MSDLDICEDNKALCLSGPYKTRSSEVQYFHFFLFFGNML